jgi:ADP-heptose:LPS heptosyltransferase
LRLFRRGPRREELKRPPVSSAAPRILIVRLSSIGDLLRFLPLASTLKRRYPAAHVTWAVGSRCKDVVEMSMDVDEVLVIDADPLSPRRSWLPALLQFAPKLWRRRYDVAIDAHSTPLSASIVALSRTGRRLGIDKPNILNIRLFPYQALDGQSATPIDYHLSVLRFFDVQLENVVVDSRLDPGTEARRTVRELVVSQEPAHEPLVAIHHDTSLKSKRWEAEKFSALANQLARETESRVMVIGEEPSERFRVIQQQCDPEIICRHGFSLRELAAFLEGCDLVIAQESGPLHLAAALGRPTVGIFGPSDPSIHTPYGDLHRTVRKGVSCSPCFRGFEFFFTCPLRTMECLTSLEVDDVARVAKLALAQTRPPR